jgi:cytochrome c
MRIVPGLICLPLLLLITNNASSQEKGDPAAGRRLVETECSACHGASEPAIRAPSFAAIAAMPSTTALSIGVFLRTSHPTMPNVMLGPGDVDDVIAYVLSLR